MDNKKSANQLYKESGTTLSFKDWIQREKTKKASFAGFDAGVDQDIIINQPLNEAIADSLRVVNKDAGNKSQVSQNKILGINKYVLIGSVVIIAGAIAYSLYKKSKK